MRKLFIIFLVILPFIVGRCGVKAPKSGVRDGRPVSEQIAQERSEKSGADSGQSAQKSETTPADITSPDKKAEKGQDTIAVPITKATEPDVQDKPGAVSIKDLPLDTLKPEPPAGRIKEPRESPVQKADTSGVGMASGQVEKDSVTSAQSQSPADVKTGAGVKKDTVSASTPATATTKPKPDDKPKTTKTIGGGEERKVVDFEADIMRPIPVGDSTAINMLGNVKFYHNGAVITCDSAVRYSERRMECFNRVVINSKTTYVYGDRADYNGETNLATVYAPIIKVVDEDATMYTYNFSFNTLDKIGIYGGGATMSQKDNLMESNRGYYYVDEREFVGVDQVEIKNPDYRLRSDSVAYNLDTEIATFYVRSYIWNSKGEILSAEHGAYSHPEKEYSFTKNAYIITGEQEVWADSIDYNSETEDALLRGNIQIRDEDQKTLGFGDYGRYWGQEQNGYLTRDPSLVNFDPEQPDTLYMRADSMFFYTFDRDVVFETTMPDEGASGQGGYRGEDEEMLMPPSAGAGDGTMMPPPAGELGVADRRNDRDAEGRLPEYPQDVDAQREAGGTGMDSDARSDKPAADSLALASGAPDSLETAVKSPKQLREAEKRAKAEAKAARDAAKKAEKEAARAAKEAEKAAKRTVKEEVGHEGHDHGEGLSPEDSLAVTDSIKLPGTDMNDIEADSSMIEDTPAILDSLGNPILTDSLATAQADTTEQDSLQRVIYGYRDVRIYREDFQAVCDSLAGFSIDSTLHLYIDPVLWNNVNQITSDIMDIYTKNQQIDKAIFRGNPFMASEVDSTMYNQIKGKVMEAYFRDNDIYRNDVKGNGQTYYYMEDDKTKELMGFLVAECADITFLIEERQMDKIIYRGSPVYSIYPMDKIPPTQDQFLPGFKWEAKRRPMTKEDVFTRSIRPSEREWYELLEQPLFPLTDSIFKDKERMIKERIWTERNDTLSPETQEFIRNVTVR